MRQKIYTPNTSLTGIQSLADIGITTGAAVGSSPYSQDAVDGKLTIDTTKLEAAIGSNPSWCQGDAPKLVRRLRHARQRRRRAGRHDRSADPGRQLRARRSQPTQIANLNEMLTQRQTALQTQFANLETALQQSQQQSNWLVSQIAQLP